MADVPKVFRLFATLSKRGRSNGVGPMARELSVPIPTVRRWEKSGVIPAWRKGAVLAAARRLKLPITKSDVTQEAA